MQLMNGGIHPKGERHQFRGPCDDRGVDQRCRMAVGRDVGQEEQSEGEGVHLPMRASMKTEVLRKR